MLQNIENPINNCDILHLKPELGVWSSSRSRDASNKSRKTGTLALLLRYVELCIKKPGESWEKCVVVVVRVYQFTDRGPRWTAGGYMVVLPAMWEFEA